MRRALIILLAFSMLLSSAFIATADNSGTDDVDLSDFLFDNESVEISTVTPAFSEMLLVKETDSIAFYFYEKGMDIYVLDKRTGELYTNVLRNEYVEYTDFSASAASQLITVSAAEKNGAARDYILYDSASGDIKAESEISDGKLTLTLNVPSMEISFQTEFGIKDNAFYYRVIDSSISENGSGRITGISVLNNFGASRYDENGYILYPDGSGSIIKFKPNDESNAKMYQFGIYGDSDVNYLQIQKNITNNVYGALLPVFGISRGNGGLLAVIDEGDDDAKINIGVPGYQLPFVYRCFFSFRYRNYSSTTFNNVDVTSLVEKRSKSDRTVYYYLLNGDKNNYSGMAAVYREHLINKGILKEKVSMTEALLNIRTLCGVRKKSLFSSKVEVMTDFSQVQSIADTLRDGGVKNLDIVLSGWCDGGWDTLPTKSSAESSLGGTGKLKKLTEKLSSDKISISLEADLINADQDTGSFNKRKNAVRNYYGESFTDKTGKKYILDACDVMPGASEKFSFSKAGLNLLSAGSLVYPDFSNKSVSTRQDIINAYCDAIKDISQSGKRVSVNIGNGYTLGCADMIYNLPQRDSGNMISDYSVPFYQMVIHGYIPYTGSYANTHYDYNSCILEWAEYGCIPSYLITGENTSKLNDTDYNTLFSSEFNEWKERIMQTYKRFNTDFSKLLGSAIVSHEKINDSVSVVRYEGGKTVYVNYGNEPAEVDGITVPGKDYLISGD